MPNRASGDIIHMKNNEFCIVPNVVAIDILNTVLVHIQSEMSFSIDRDGSTMDEEYNDDFSPALAMLRTI